MHWAGVIFHSGYAREAILSQNCSCWPRVSLLDVRHLHLQDHALQLPACDLLQGISSIPGIVELHEGHALRGERELDVRDVPKLTKLSLEVCLLHLGSYPGDEQPPPMR
eukprot:CAMPEP_0179080684 /NCGR_PEP_ID=MMETSP0796-20121207/36275_1 /TAXON_ID=73915 /ORGANISM="Pyrodinium bahamense, Strain pbaha01" /LENGTH=108 /DNA_ID=CAMNT_0020778039 /DNA_START=58 /DNA_END=384 /DNA_ORIENTATION=-